MPADARQLPLNLPHRAAMTRADFLVGSPNEKAIALIDRWPDWPARAVLLVGPAGSGKSHLVEIWRVMSGANIVAGGSLGEADVEAHVSLGVVAVEDLHAAPIDEPALFHLLNLAGERKAFVLMTSRVNATVLPLMLPDLASRLRAAQPVELAEPDDDLLRRVLVKLFADRQLPVDPAVVDYIALRMERSLEAASFIVGELDREALAGQRRITRPLAGQTLRRIYGGAGDQWPEEPEI